MNNSNDQENISTKQSPSREETRLSLTDGDEKRASGASTPSGKGTQTFDAVPLLNSAETPPEKLTEKLDFSLPKAQHVRKPAEFRHVYANGKRFDGRFMSAFVLPNNLDRHRLGITASRKGVGNAVQRNRAKRLLREAFRLSKIELKNLRNHYDFVLNARRNLLKVKLPEPLADFQKLIGQIASKENSFDQTASGKQKEANSTLTKSESEQNQ